MTITRKGTILMRPPGFARRGGESPEFTKKRKKNRAKAKLSRAARKKR